LNRKHERERSPISGIQLPDISGLAVTKLLKDDETLKSIPIIAVTVRNPGFGRGVLLGLALMGV
jgi:DNA-binding response OmpR family regulator